jgi:hypothetical protein
MQTPSANGVYYVIKLSEVPNACRKQESAIHVQRLEKDQPTLAHMKHDPARTLKRPSPVPTVLTSLRLATCYVANRLRTPAEVKVAWAFASTMHCACMLHNDVMP